MLPILQGSLITVGPWFSTHGRKGLRVYPYQRGGVVKTASSSTTITLHDSGDIAADDYVMVCTAGSYGEDNVWTPALSKVAKVTAVASNVLTISGSGLTVAVGDYCLCLGADTGGTAPNFDASDLTLYDDPAGTTASSYDYLLTGSSSGFIGWVNRGAIECDLLVTDSSNVPLSVEIAKPLLQQRVNYAYRGTRPTHTIASGEITLADGLEASEVILAAESSTTDTLDTITGGVAGDVLYLTADSGDTITVSETDNVSLESTVALTGDLILTLRYDGTTWDEISYTSASGGSSSLPSSPATDDLAKWDGSDWVPVELTVATTTVSAETVIERIDVTIAVANFDFTEIPQTYDHVKVRMTIRSSDTGDNDNLSTFFNNDTTSTNYYQTRIAGRNTAAVVQEGNSELGIRFTGGGSPSDTFGSVEFTLLNYTKTDKYMTYWSSIALDETTTEQQVAMNMSTWRNTAAVTRITLSPFSGGNFVTGSFIELIGIKNQTVVTAVSLTV